jgi:protein-S-isoprenylcysteine O-methyltransferase Ste14
MKDFITALSFMLVIVLAHALPEFIIRNTPAWFNALIAVVFVGAIISIMVWGVKRLIERERNANR